MLADVFGRAGQPFPEGGVHMRNIVLAATCAAALLAAAAPAGAMILDPGAARSAAASIDLVDQTACWRWGWHGWGWYPCWGWRYNHWHHWHHW
jgi:hypothetical protein